MCICTRGITLSPRVHIHNTQGTYLNLVRLLQVLEHLGAEHAVAHHHRHQQHVRENARKHFPRHANRRHTAATRMLRRQPFDVTECRRRRRCGRHGLSSTARHRKPRRNRCPMIRAAIRRRRSRAQRVSPSHLRVTATMMATAACGGKVFRARARPNTKRNERVAKPVRVRGNVFECVVLKPFVPEKLPGRLSVSRPMTCVVVWHHMRVSARWRLLSNDISSITTTKADAPAKKKK